MQLNTVIFDMDGLLIDSEPFWHIAAQEIFGKHNIALTPEQYATTTGLRTQEFVAHWLGKYGVDKKHFADAENNIIKIVIELVEKEGKAMNGVFEIFDFFASKNFKIGLATSSSFSLIDAVLNKLNIRKYLQVISSADGLPNGKPHPQVYLNCAKQLESLPTECICFEDSFNGMIAVLAARMQCIVVPATSDFKNPKWGAAHLKLSSLLNFNELLLQSLI